MVFVRLERKGRLLRVHIQSTALVLRHYLSVIAAVVPVKADIFPWEKSSAPEPGTCEVALYPSSLEVVILVIQDLIHVATIPRGGIGLQPLALNWCTSEWLSKCPDEFFPNHLTLEVILKWSSEVPSA